jgi:hypothetical protein
MVCDRHPDDLSDNFANEFGIDNIDPAKAVMYQYVGLVFGDLVQGLSAILSRAGKKLYSSFTGLMCIFIAVYFLYHKDETSFYVTCFGLGFWIGSVCFVHHYGG